MDKKILMLSDRIDRLEERVFALENSCKIRTYKSHYKVINKEIIISILNEAISRGTIKENAEEYVLDKKIVHSIIHKKNIRKYDFNKSLKEMEFVIGQKRQNLAYKQVRVYGRTIWAYVIDKRLFKKAVEEIENGR